MYNCFMYNCTIINWFVFHFGTGKMGMSKGYRTQLLDFSKLLITDFNLMVSQTRIGFHKKDQVKEKEKSFNANA